MYFTNCFLSVGNETYILYIHTYIHTDEEHMLQIIVRALGRTSNIVLKSNFFLFFESVLSQRFNLFVYINLKIHGHFNRRVNDFVH